MKILNDYETNLVLKNISSAATPADKQELEAWMAMSKENRLAYEELLRLWEIAEDPSENLVFNTDSAWEKVNKKIVTPHKPLAKTIRLRPWLPLSIAASFSLIIAIAWLFIAPYYKNLQTIVIQTGKEEKNVTLPDGSSIRLSKNSTVSYPGKFEERNITLDGKAFFDVQKDPQHPFTISANYSVVTVLGTSFKVFSEKHNKNDTIEVFSGKVSCASKLNATEKVVVYPGHIATVATEGKIVTSAVEQKKILALNSKLNFNNTKLSDVIKSLQRKFGVTIKLVNEKLNNCRYTGTFENENISQIIEIIAVSMNLNYQKQHTTYILNGEECP